MSEPHDVPTAAELVDAVREFLHDDLMERLEGRDRFLTRVAANALWMVARELELGPAQAAAHADRLEALGVADDTDLATRIRSGELDHRYDEVKAAVWESVKAKLAVANPDHR